jgi:CxxC-x17-CxxC domain-containing protein
MACRNRQKPVIHLVTFIPCLELNSNQHQVKFVPDELLERQTMSGDGPIEDRILQCMSCNEPFIFSAGEQIFFREKQFVNDPKHCKRCKAKKGTTTKRTRPEIRCTCAECGTATVVPFRPVQGRPVLCRACFQDSQNRVPSFPEQPSAG